MDKPTLYFHRGDAWDTSDWVAHTLKGIAAGKVSFAKEGPTTGGEWLGNDILFSVIVRAHGSHPGWANYVNCQCKVTGCVDPNGRHGWCPRNACKRWQEKWYDLEAEAQKRARERREVSNAEAEARQVMRTIDKAFAGPCTCPIAECVHVQIRSRIPSLKSI